MLWTLRVGVFMALLVWLVAGLLLVVRAQAPRPAWIAFVSTRAGGQRDIYLMHSDGSHLRRLTHSAEVEDEVAWSPDGSRLVFNIQPRNHFSAYRHLKTLHLHGSQAQQLTTELADYLTPIWSPDGQWIIFSSRQLDPHQNRMLYHIPATGGSVQRVTGWPNPDYHPTFSPDGQWLVFATTLDGDSRLNLHRMRPDGSERQQLTNTSDNDSQPSLSPDGRQIAYVRFREGKSELYRLDLQTGAIHNITLSDAYTLAPRWSPDGEWIVFASNRGGDFDIYRVRADGSGLQNLTNHPAEDMAPAWSPLIDRDWHGGWLAVGGAFWVLAGVWAYQHRSRRVTWP